jgi:hypothetical protein
LWHLSSSQNRTSAHFTFKKSIRNGVAVDAISRQFPSILNGEFSQIDQLMNAVPSTNETRRCITSETCTHFQQNFD